MSNYWVIRKDNHEPPKGPWIFEGKGGNSLKTAVEIHFKPLNSGLVHLQKEYKTSADNKSYYRAYYLDDSDKIPQYFYVRYGFDSEKERNAQYDISFGHLEIIRRISKKDNKQVEESKPDMGKYVGELELKKIANRRFFVSRRKIIEYA